MFQSSGTAHTVAQFLEYGDGLQAGRAGERRVAQQLLDVLGRQVLVVHGLLRLGEPAEHHLLHCNVQSSRKWYNEIPYKHVLSSLTSVSET